MAVPSNQASTSKLWPLTLLSVLLTYCAVLVAQVFFRAASVSDALQMLAGMSGLHGLAPDVAAMQSLKTSSISMWAGRIAICFFCAWTMPNSNEIVARFERVSPPAALQGLFYAAMICVIVIGTSGPPAAFLYFQF
jgi:alginate O-acetyltransferase complex protein AlgI